MKTKILLSALLMLFCLNLTKAQSHNLRPGSWCKLRKNYARDESESARCLACDATQKKEKAARAAEDKRRDDIAVAKIKSDRIATENQRLEKLRLAKEEEKKAKDKEISDKVIQDNILKQNKQIAENGEIKSNTKGIVEKINPSSIVGFSDRNRRVYGLILDGKEIITFPYEESRTQIDKIKNTNLFEVMVMGKHPNGWEKYLYSFIIDFKGNKLSVNGISKFDYPIDQNNKSNKIYLYKKLTEPERIGSKCEEAKSFGAIFQSKEAAVADISKGTGSVCIATSMVSANVKVYSVDYNFKLLEQIDGYIILDYWKSGLYR